MPVTPLLHVPPLYVRHFLCQWIKTLVPLAVVHVLPSLRAVTSHPSPSPPGQPAALSIHASSLANAPVLSTRYGADDIMLACRHAPLWSCRHSVLFPDSCRQHAAVTHHYYCRQLMLPQHPNSMLCAVSSAHALPSLACFWFICLPSGQFSALPSTKLSLVSTQYFATNNNIN